MNTSQIAFIAYVELLFVATLITALMVHAFWQRRQDHVRLTRQQHTQSLIHRCLETGTITDDDSRTLRKLSARTRLDVLQTFASIFTGEERMLLHELADIAGLIRLAERRCKSHRWSHRLEGIRLFTLFGGGEHIVPSLLDDRNEEVRAGAAEWAAGEKNVAVIERLLPLLADTSKFCRFMVKDSFLRIGAPSADPLLKYLEETEFPAYDALDVSRWIADVRFLPVALRLATHHEPHIRLRVMWLLAAIGGSQALTAIETHVSDDDAAVRVASLQALQKLADWRCGETCARALSDPEWKVRKEAGRTLLSLGPPGVVILRSTLRSTDAFAADMAQHMLDMPPEVMVTAH